MSLVRLLRSVVTPLPTDREILDSVSGSAVGKYSTACMNYFYVSMSFVNLSFQCIVLYSLFQLYPCSYVRPIETFKKSPDFTISDIKRN